MVHQAGMLPFINQAYLREIWTQFDGNCKDYSIRYLGLGLLQIYAFQTQKTFRVDKHQMSCGISCLNAYTPIDAIALFQTV